MAILRGYTIDQPDVQQVIKSAKEWQEQADSISEESTNAELIDAFIDWGIAQGCLNSLRQIKIISSMDYESISKRQLKIREKLNRILEARRKA